MQIDFTKLLGFDTVSDELSKGLDFQNEKASEGGLRVVDFQGETLGAKLGAKVGEPESASDARLKRDIEHVATRADGLPIYSFRYLWDDEVHVGVMAQDLLRNEAWRSAVVTKEGGALAVNYAKIGLRKATLEEWLTKGMEALIRETEE